MCHVSIIRAKTDILSNFAGLNIHRTYILLGSLAEVKEPAKLALEVEYTEMQPFWISGKVGVLLSTAEIVYQWPPRFVWICKVPGSEQVVTTSFPQMRSF